MGSIRFLIGHIQCGGHSTKTCQQHEGQVSHSDIRVLSEVAANPCESGCTDGPIPDCFNEHQAVL